MPKRATNHVYEVLRAVYELEKDLKRRSPDFEGVAHIDECWQNLREARHRLHEVLNEVTASDFKAPDRETRQYDYRPEARSG